MTKRASSAIRDEAVRCYVETTQPTTEIAHKFGVTVGTINYWCRMAGVKWRKNNAEEANRYAELRDEFSELYRQGVEREEIATRLGVALATIGRWRVELNLPTRVVIPANRAEQRAEFECLYRETPMGARAIARKLGISIELGKSWRRSLGLPPKPSANSHISRRLNPTVVERESSTKYGSLWMREVVREQNALAEVDACWARHPSIVKARSLAFYYANHEQSKERGRANAKRIYHERKTDAQWIAKKRETARAWHRRNPEKKRQSTDAWIAKNPERYRAMVRRARKKLQDDPKYRALHNLRTRLRQLVSRGRAVSVKQNSLIGCAPSFLVTYLTVRFKPGMTWENYGSAWHIDHVAPCASFDLSKKREVRKCFHFTNLQPLWAQENADKLDRVPTQQEFAI
jgi:transposase